MDVLSVTGSHTRFCLLSTVGALMASWTTLSRYLYAHQTDCASSKRSLRDLKYLWTLSFAPPRKAIQVRRRCNECTNQSPFFTSSLLLMHPSFCFSTFRRRLSHLFFPRSRRFMCSRMPTNFLRILVRAFSIVYDANESPKTDLHFH